MDEHLKGVEALLGISLGGLTEKQAALVNKLAGDLWDQLREYAEVHELDIRDLFAISLTTHYTLTNIVNEEMNRL